MKWLRKANDWWLAQGEFVKFSIYREHGVWKGFYELKSGRFKRLPWRKTLKEMKELCENNVHWE